MANTVNITGKLTVSDTYGAKDLNRSFSITPTGTKYFAQKFTAGTAAGTLVHSLASMRYLDIVNPTDSGATVTVTMSPMVLKPGDVLLGPPSSSVVTVQATGTVNAEIVAAASEA